MGILATWLGGQEAGDDMARANTKPLDEVKIDNIVATLRQAVGDAEFKCVCSTIAQDPDLSAGDLIAIAQRYVGGAKPKSRKGAMTAIGQERLRQSHARAKASSAAKTRVW